MNKNFVFFFFAWMMSFITTNAYAYDIAVENADGVTIYYNYINDSDSLEVTYSEHKEYSYSGVVVIPSEVSFMNRTFKVTNIGEFAFVDCWDLDSLAIPNSVTTIGDHAFSECRRLNYLTIPRGVTSIGEGMCWGCMSLIGVTIPDGVTSIGNHAFTYCLRLDNVTIPNSVVSIDDFAFWVCESLTSIVIPDGVTTIGDYAFNGCSSLSSVTLPNSVKSIGQGVFEYCNIQSVTSLIKEPFAIEGKDVKDNRTFSEYTFNNATLYVPLGTIDKYKAKEGWKDFSQIRTVHGLEYDYRPFIEPFKMWRTGIPNPDGDGYNHIYHYRLFHDAVINGLSWICRSAIRIIGHGVEAEIDTIRVGLLFEENRKVYHASPDTQDFTLLYDFVSPVGSDINIAGEDLTIINKEWVQDDSFKGECIYLQAKDSEQPTICWMEGVGNMSNPMESLYTTGTSNEVLLYCKVGDEVLYYNGNPFLNGIGGEVKKNTIDFTHVVKAQPKAPRRDGNLSLDPSTVREGREGSEEEEMPTGAYSINELFVDFKSLTGIYAITIFNDSGTEVYRKEVQTSNVMGLNKLIGGYAKGVYTLTVENDTEAYTAEFSIDEEVGIGRPTPDPSRNGGEKAGAWYDLSGRQIVNSKSSNGKWNKGIYIRDGKKVVVR